MRVEVSGRTNDGTALGLAIVKGFAEAMGVTVIGDQPRAAVSRKRTGARVAPLKILIVDDELAIRRLLRGTLARAGYAVVEADTARAALSVLAVEKPELVLLDLGLPDRDGLELVSLLKDHAAVIIISARNETDDKVAALDFGADDFVTKPFDTVELLARIRVSLRNRLAGKSEVSSARKVRLKSA